MDEDYERKFFSTFDKYNAFLEAQKRFLVLDSVANCSAEEKTEHDALYLKLISIVRGSLFWTRRMAVKEETFSLTNIKNNHIFSILIWKN